MSVEIMYLVVKSQPYHARGRKDIPAESDAISVFDLAPAVLERIVLSLVHSRRYLEDLFTNTCWRREYGKSDVTFLSSGLKLQESL